MIIELKADQLATLMQWLQRPNGASRRFTNSSGDWWWFEAVEGGGVLMRTSSGAPHLTPVKELPPQPFRGFDLLKILQAAIPTNYRAEARIVAIFHSPVDYVIELRFHERPVARLDRFTERMGMGAQDWDEIWMDDVVLLIDVLNDALRKHSLRKAPSVKTKLEWKKGPENGGGGTAGGTAEESYWWDGDLLLVVVEVSDGSRDVDVVRVHADEGIVSFRNRDDDDYGWGPEAIAWYAKLEETNLPPRL